MLPLADIVKASDEDLEPFEFAADTHGAARAAYEEMGNGMLVLTEGRGGALLHTTRGIVEASAYPIANVVDTVGAGDTFHAAFLASLIRSNVDSRSIGDADRETLRTTIDFACAAAAINVSRDGCNPPTYSEVENFVLAAKR